MARDFLPFIKNHYDLITTEPPSANRCPNRYCVYDLAKAISRMTEIPFVPAFSRKTDKMHHGRYASINQSKPKFLESWNIRNRSILFVDDCITSGTTARLCYEVLVDLGNHVEGLILEATLRIVIVSIGLFTFNMLKLFQIHIPTYYRFK